MHFQIEQTKTHNKVTLSNNNVRDAQSVKTSMYLCLISLNITIQTLVHELTFASQ